MEKEINKLIELAREYVAFGKEVGFMQSHNRLRGLLSDPHIRGGQISVYFDDDYNSSSVKFGETEIIFYANEIQLPLDVTKEYLVKTYKDCANFLNTLKTDRKELVKKQMEEQKIKKIEKLKAELELLEK